MQYEYYYDRPSGCWWAFWKDSNGFQIGEAIHASTKEEVLIVLGEIKQDRYDQL